VCKASLNHRSNIQKNQASLEDHNAWEQLPAHLWASNALRGSSNALCKEVSSDRDYYSNTQTPTTCESVSPNLEKDINA